MTNVTGIPGVNIVFGEEDEDNFTDLDAALKQLREGVDETQPAVLLLQGAKEGDLDKVKRALGNGAPVNAAAVNGDTALHLAVRSGEALVVRHLILNKADVNAEDGRGYAPLNLAAERGEEVIGGMLLSAGANPEHAIPKINETPIITAAHKGCEKLLQRLITRRVHIDAADCNGVTAAMRAAGGGHAECLDLLTRAGADLERKSKAGSTAHDFARRGRAQRCLNILEGAGDVQSALVTACANGIFTAVKAALEAGADVNKPDEAGNMALHLAVRSKKMEIIEFLLEQKPEINVNDGPGDTPLGIALQLNNYRIAKLLVELGADPDQPTGPQKKTPLMLACAGIEDRNIDLLLDAKAALDIQDAGGRTALMHVPFQRTDVMKKLLDLGAHPGFKNAAGQNVLDMHKVDIRAAEAVKFLQAYLPELDARVQERGSLRAITPLKAIKVKMKTPAGGAP